MSTCILDLVVPGCHVWTHSFAQTHLCTCAECDESLQPHCSACGAGPRAPAPGAPPLSRAPFHAKGGVVTRLPWQRVPEAPVQPLNSGMRLPVPMQRTWPHMFTRYSSSTRVRNALALGSSKDWLQRYLHCSSNLMNICAPSEHCDLSNAVGDGGMLVQARELQVSSCVAPIAHT